MLEFLTKELREGLDLARARRGRRSRLHVEVGGAVIPVLRLTADTLVMDAARAPRLRGYVDVFDGARHVLHGLIVAQSVEDGLLVCTFKSQTPAQGTPPVDYERNQDAPAGLLPPPARA